MPASSAIGSTRDQRDRTSRTHGGRWSRWQDRRRTAVAARVVWDALCQLEVTLKRPLPDAARQERAVAEAHAEVQAVWARYGFSLATHLDASHRSVVQRAVSVPDDVPHAEWENRLADARDALATYIR